MKNYLFFCHFLIFVVNIFGQKEIVNEYGLLSEGSESIIAQNGIDVMGVFIPVNKDTKVAIALKKEKWGLVDQNFKELIPFVNEDISQCSKSTFLVFKDGKYRFYNCSNKSFSDNSFQKVDIDFTPKDNFFQCFLNDTMGICDSLGNFLFNYSKIDKLLSFSGKTNGDAQGNADIASSINYSDLYSLSPVNTFKPLLNGTYFEICAKNGYYFLVDKAGHVIKTEKYHFTSLIESSNEIILLINDQYEVTQIINSKGKYILPKGYKADIGMTGAQDVFWQHCKANALIVSFNNLYGLIDFNGKILIEPKYKKIRFSSVKNNFILKSATEQFTYSLGNGMKKLPQKLFLNSLETDVIKFGNKFYYYDIQKQNNEIQVAIYDSLGVKITNFYESMRFYLDNTIHAAEKDGKVVILDTNFRSFLSKSEKISPYYSENGIYCYKDTLSLQMFSTRNSFQKQFFGYDSYKGSINDNAFCFFKEGKYGVIDSLNNILIPFIFDNIEFGNLSDINFLRCIQNGKYFYYDKYLKPIEEAGFVSFLKGNILVVQVSEELYIMKRNGKVIAERKSFPREASHKPGIFTRSINKSHPIPYFDYYP